MLAALALLVACSSRDGAGPQDASLTAAEIPGGPPSIRGVVTAIEAGRVRIEENPAETFGSGKAVVQLEGSRIRRRSGGAATATDLALGQRLSAWFTGPVAESYPVQVAGAVIVIEADAP